MVTKHTCNGGKGPHFGRRTPGCPRCDELQAGFAPREAPARLQAAQRRRAEDAQRAEEIRAHFAPGGPHATGKCGRVCTFGDW